MKDLIFLTYLAPANVLSRAQESFETISSSTELVPSDVLRITKEKNPKALIVTPRQKMTAEIIKELPDSVKIIATSSVGFDHLDVAAAKERGIVLTNTPDVLTECTADLAMMLMLDASRRGREYLEIMKDGWGKPYSQSEMLGIKISGKTLGIYGMGRIGRALADRARGFGMKILYCNTKRLTADLEKDATYFEDFREMLPHCEFLSLNAPGTPATKNVMNDETFALLPTNAILVNVSRGSLVDEEALMRALDSKHLFAAGLDVFQNEPDFNKKLANYKNIFLTPHMGSATIETRDAMGFRALQNVKQVLKGHKAQDALW